MHRLVFSFSVITALACGARVEDEERRLPPSAVAGGNSLVSAGAAGELSAAGMPSSRGGMSSATGGMPSGTGGAPTSIGGTPNVAGAADALAGAGGEAGAVDDDTAARAACVECRGDWGRHGLSPIEGCNCRTDDFGNQCRDETGCEGQCLADVPTTVETEVGPPRTGYFLGRCSEFRSTFGCHAVLTSGFNAGDAVLLDEPIPVRCWD